MRADVFIRDRDQAKWYGFPSPDGRTIKVAYHHGGARWDPDTVDRSVHVADITLLAEAVTDSLVGVQPAPIRALVCLYANTPDERFVLGRLPDSPRITVLGFKFAPSVGAIGADLATTGSTDRPISAFDPRRFMGTVVP